MTDYSWDADCGCRFNYSWELSKRASLTSKWASLIHCPRHAAADALYEALKAECNYWGSPPVDKWSYDSVREDNWKRSRAALALADGERPT
jgi:hypothetical protein